MTDYKLEAAKAAVNFIKPGQKVGLGGGSTILKLINLITENARLAQSLTYASSAFDTRKYLIEKGLLPQLSAEAEGLTVYFDGCDQFDQYLNAFKSCGGIHTSEKIMAAGAQEFVLIGDDGKFVKKLDTRYPLVVEILPEALPVVLKKLRSNYPQASSSVRMDTHTAKALVTANGNLLAEIRFNALPDLAALNTNIKMIAGVVDHSLFYNMATKAIIAGERGVRVLKPYNRHQGI